MNTPRTATAVPQPFNAAQRGFVGKEGRGHVRMGRSNPRSFACGAHLIRSPLPAPPRQSPRHAHRTATLTYNWQTLEVGLADNFLHTRNPCAYFRTPLSLARSRSLSRARLSATRFCSKTSPVSPPSSLVHISASLASHQACHQLDGCCCCCYCCCGACRPVLRRRWPPRYEPGLTLPRRWRGLLGRRTPASTCIGSPLPTNGNKRLRRSPCSACSGLTLFIPSSRLRAPRPP